MKHIILSILFLASFSITAATFSGKVVAVIDGDTFDMVANGKQIRIRFHGVDAPESHQDFGQKAKQILSSLIYGKEVTCTEAGSPSYGRPVCEVYLPDQTWVNLELVKTGAAWHSTKYSSDKRLADAQKTAQQNKTGLWSLPNPIPPWEFRKSQKNN